MLLIKLYTYIKCFFKWFISEDVWPFLVLYIDEHMPHLAFPDDFDKRKYFQTPDIFVLETSSKDSSSSYTHEELVALAEKGWKSGNIGNFFLKKTFFLLSLQQIFELSISNIVQSFNGNKLQNYISDILDLFLRTMSCFTKCWIIPLVFPFEVFKIAEQWRHFALSVDVSLKKCCQVSDLYFCGFSESATSTNSASAPSYPSDSW